MRSEEGWIRGKGWDINFRVQWIHLHCIHNTILFITWLTAKTHTTLQLHTIQTFLVVAMTTLAHTIITEYTPVHVYMSLCSRIHEPLHTSSEPTICKLLQYSNWFSRL